MSSKSDLAVSVRGLSKAYTITHQGERPVTLAESLLARVRRPFTRAEKETFWALKNVEFDIQKGDVVGIIGRNGAGKSTLLKILSRITQPTTGRIDLYGRVGSLLEVGTGFHPELTGRENIFLNGAILGMTKAEIRRQFDEIVAFAGVERFLDTPVKRYSSGMYVRLAFAVAAHLQSEILIVDEVLAVGDTAFQKKCIGKMREVSDKTGVAVLFVSHNLSAISTLCNRSILLKNGTMQFYDDTNVVIRRYMAENTSNRATYRPDMMHPSCRSGFCLIEARASDRAEDPQDTVSIQSPVVVTFEYAIMDRLSAFRITFQVTTDDGIPVFTSKDWSNKKFAGVPKAAGRYTTKCEIPANLFNEGIYTIDLSIDIPFVEVLFEKSNALSFEIVRDGGVMGDLPERWPGIICPIVNWSCESHQSEGAAFKPATLTDR